MLELLAGAAVFVGGWALGQINLRQRNKGPNPVKPICPCEHHIGTHENRTGRCHATVDGSTPDARYSTGVVLSWVQVPCSCQVYSGPELVGLYTQQGLAELPHATEE